MAHKGKWSKICSWKSGQECFNCANRQNIKETKTDIIVSCDIGYGTRKLTFSRRINQVPYCGAWKNTSK